MFPPLKTSTLLGFKKAQSSIAKMISMIENDTYCVDVMQQNMAVIGLLKSAHQTMMENHLKSCFSKAMETKDARKKEEMIKEILKVTKWCSK